MKWFSILILLAALPAMAQVDIKQQADRMEVTIDGKPFTTFYYGADTRKPYLHPLRSASGKIVSRHFPMENIEGESKDHPHHRGLWFTHGEVNGWDFWANEATQKGPKKTKVVLDKVGPVKSGKKKGTIQATFNWVDPQDKPILKESRIMTFYSDPQNRILDIDITPNALEKLHFGDTKEGTFAIRIATPLEEPTPKAKGPARTGRMVNAEGLETESKAWGKRSAWMDYAGELEGEKLGIAIMDHPSSTRYPTYWHSRSYGLFAANPFGIKDFTRDKTQDGSLTVEQGKSIHFRYRVVIHPGDHKAAGIAGMYEKFRRTK